MKRRNYEGSGTLPGMEDEGPETARPAREARTNDSPRATAKPSSARSRKIWTPKLIISSIAVAFTLALSLYAFHVVEQFLLGDSRFALNGIEGEVSTLSVSGATHASERAIEAVFAEDQGRSVYSIPLGERRISLTTVDWVKDASVARLWPNRLWVRVWERTPIAFVMLRGSRFGMIDEDGVILPQTKDRFHLPVLTGVRAADPLEERKVRVQRMLRLTTELGDDAAQLAEIDVTDRDNLKVSTAVQGHVLWMYLQEIADLGLRYRNFLKHFDEIRKKLPGADTFDLRLEDRITAVE